MESEVDMYNIKEEDISVIFNDYDDNSSEKMAVPIIEGYSQANKTSPVENNPESLTQEMEAYCCRMVQDSFLKTCKFPSYLRINVLRGIGKGVITSKKLSKGDLITYYDGERIYAERDFTDLEHYLEISSITNIFWINGTADDSGIAKYIKEDRNTPNISLGWGMSWDKYYPVFYALQDINIGDELCYRYEGHTEAYSWKTFKKHGSMVVSETIMNCCGDTEKVILLNDEETDPIGAIEQTEVKESFIALMSYIDTRLEDLTTFVNLCLKDLEESAFLEYFNDLSLYRKNFHEFVEKLLVHQDNITNVEFFEFKKHFSDFSEKVLESLYCLVHTNHVTLKTSFQEITRISSEVGFELIQGNNKVEKTPVLNDYLIQLSQKLVQFMHAKKAISFIIREVDVLKLAITEIEMEIKNVIAGNVNNSMENLDSFQSITPIVQATTSILNCRNSTDLSVIKMATAKAKKLIIDMLKINSQTDFNKSASYAVITANLYVIFLNSLISFRQSKNIDEKELLTAAQSVFLSLPSLSKSVKGSKVLKRSVLPINSDSLEETLIGSTLTEETPIKLVATSDENITVKRKLNCDTEVEKTDLTSESVNELSSNRSPYANKKQKFNMSSSRIDHDVAQATIEPSDNFVARIPPYNHDSNTCLEYDSNKCLQVNLNKDKSSLNLDNKYEISVLRRIRLSLPLLDAEIDSRGNVSDNITRNLPGITTKTGNLKRNKTVTDYRESRKYKKSAQCRQSEDNAMVKSYKVNEILKYKNTTDLKTEDRHISMHDDQKYVGITEHEDNISTESQPTEIIKTEDSHISMHDDQKSVGITEHEDNISTESQPTEIIKTDGNHLLYIKNNSYAINPLNAEEYFKSIETYNYIINNYRSCLTRKLRSSQGVTIMRELIFLREFHICFNKNYSRINENSTATIFLDNIIEVDVGLHYTKICLNDLSLPKSSKRMQQFLVLQRLASLLKNMHISRNDYLKANLATTYKQYLLSHRTKMYSQYSRGKVTYESIPDKIAESETIVERQSSSKFFCRRKNGYFVWSVEDWEKLDAYCKHHYETSGRQNISTDVLRQFFEENNTILSGFRPEIKIMKARVKLINMKRKYRL